MHLRKIEPHDNPSVAAMIRSVLVEFNVPKVGTAYADPQLDCMAETYSKPRSAYFIIEQDGQIVGGAGIAPLENGQGNTCELQKMYFLEAGRGKGLGKLMMQHCLKAAKDFGFESCYLETMPNMLAAQKLYGQSGFEYLETPMGNTGHHSCPVWMLKKL